MTNNIASLRRQYSLKKLSKLDTMENPVDQFGVWLNEALECCDADATAMSVSTVNKNNKPSSRIVLLKHFDNNGFVFFTSYQSRKGIDLKDNSYAALLFYWSELERQVRIEGKTEKVTEDISDEYFDSRPEKSRVSAIISPQSRPVENRKKLEEMRDDYLNSGNADLKRPSNWGGYRVIPEYFEFWQGREDRLHDRIIFVLKNGKWEKERIAP